MTEITMPKLSDSMEEGTIVAWVLRDGDTASVGDDLVEIETDKATTTYAAEAAGVLTIVAPEGETLPVGAPIARLGAAAEDGAPREPVVPGEPAVPGAGGAADAGASAPAAPPAPALVANGSGDGAAPAAGRPLRVTPLAKRVALAHGIALESVAGTGPLGRVTRRDVLAAAGVAFSPSPLPGASATDEDLRRRMPAERAPDDRGLAAPAVPVQVAPPAAVATAKGAVELLEPTRLQQVVARRMAEAKATVPDFQVQTDATVDAALAFRAQLKATGGPAPSVNDLVVKAAALALREHPLANGSYRDGRYELYERVNVGVAVAADDGLVVPTVFDADRSSLGTIAAETRRLAQRVRDNTVTPPELAGATFTVSNLGMYGMTAIVPVVNAPQAAILGVGVTRAVLARDESGEVVERRLMTLTLSCDHRILNGADAARLLSRIRELLEQPLLLAL
jgi:pyruvate dehydrogenase E2 component (dihydrolipoamide acetyltransferase)